MAAVRLWPTFIPSVGLDSETSDESGHGVLEMVQFSVAGIERGELWTMDRFVDLILGEIPRLRDDAHGYGPLGRGFIGHVMIPPEVDIAWKTVTTAMQGDGKTTWRSPLETLLVN